MPLHSPSTVSGTPGWRAQFSMMDRGKRGTIGSRNSVPQCPPAQDMRELRRNFVRNVAARVDEQSRDIGSEL